MGKLMEEFKALEQKGLWWEEAYPFPGLQAREFPYEAYIHPWQDRFKLSVIYNDYSLRRDLTDVSRQTHDTLEAAKSEAMKAIRTDVMWREFMTEGPERLIQLEAEVLELRRMMNLSTERRTWPVGDQ